MKPAMPGSLPDGPRRLAVAVSGGISLGAFLAGVSYELVRLARARPGEFRPDVWAGASAGGMNAAVAGWCLALDRDPYPLYRAWVELADMGALLGTGSDGVLDSGHVARVVESVLPGEGSPDEDVLPTGRFPVYVGMTVTNLNGLIGRPAAGKGPRVRDHAETRYFRLAPDGQDAAHWRKVWQKVRGSVRMSGAFPLAFAPVPDSSQLVPPSENLADRCLDFPLYASRGEPFPVAEGRLHATYCDGGVVNNKPVRLAIELADLLGAPEPGRQYLFVDTDKVTGLEDGLSRRQAFDHVDVGVAALTLARTQQLASDLRLIYRRNEQAAKRDELREKLRALLDRELPAEIEELLSGRDGVCPYRQVDVSLATPLDALRVPEAHPWLRPVLRKALDEWRQARAWEALEEGDWDELERSVRAEDLLASDFLDAFGGFFHRAYRDYDFALGRISAIGWLRRMGGGWRSLLPDDVAAYLDAAPGLPPVRDALDLPGDPAERSLDLLDRLMLGQATARGLFQAGADALGRGDAPPTARQIARRRWFGTLLLDPLAALLKVLPRRG